MWFQLNWGPVITFSAVLFDLADPLTVILPWLTHFCLSLTVISNLHLSFASSFIPKLPTLSIFSYCTSSLDGACPRVIFPTVYRVGGYHLPPSAARSPPVPKRLQVCKLNAGREPGNCLKGIFKGDTTRERIIAEQMQQNPLVELGSDAYSSPQLLSLSELWLCGMCWFISVAACMTQWLTDFWADLVCERHTAGHLVDVLLRVELIPLVKRPAQLRSGKTCKSHSRLCPGMCTRLHLRVWGLRVFTFSDSKAPNVLLSSEEQS